MASIGVRVERPVRPRREDALRTRYVKRRFLNSNRFSNRYYLSWAINYLSVTMTFTWPLSGTVTLVRKVPPCVSIPYFVGTPHVTLVSII